MGNNHPLAFMSFFLIPNFLEGVVREQTGLQGHLSPQSAAWLLG